MLPSMGTIGPRCRGCDGAKEYQVNVVLVVLGTFIAIFYIATKAIASASKRLFSRLDYMMKKFCDKRECGDLMDSIQNTSILENICLSRWIVTSILEIRMMKSKK